jgi:hypothetical protein
MITFHCLRLETPHIWRAGPPYWYPSGRRWPNYTPRGTGFPFRRLLRLVDVFEPDSTQGLTTEVIHPLKLTKLRGLRPQANYTVQATATCQRSKCQPLRVKDVAWSAHRIPTAVNFGFPDRSRYFFIQVAPQLSSRGWVDPVSQKIW